jgi:hypothetical protein
VNDRVVETESVFDRHAATDLSVAYAILRYLSRSLRQVDD